jgi:hypothetical protein
MAVWQRKPQNQVHVHSDQGSQFTGYEWQGFLEQHNLDAIMSRRGNRWDNEPPRVYRRVKLSKDDPYDTAQTYPVLYG